MGVDAGIESRPARPGRVGVEGQVGPDHDSHLLLPGSGDRREEENEDEKNEEENKGKGKGGEGKKEEEGQEEKKEKEQEVEEQEAGGRREKQ